MVSSVSSSGNGIYVTGTASGLDTGSLIEAAVAQKTARADTIDDKIDANTQKISSYQELLSLVQDLQNSVENMRLVTSATGLDSSIFDSKSSSLSSSLSTLTASNVLSVSTSDDAQVGSYDIEVVQLAKQMKVSSNELDVSTSELGYDGSFTLGSSVGSATINVTSDASLSDIAASINAQSSTTGVTASVIIVSGDKSKLILSAINAADVIQAVFVSGDNVLQSMGFNDTSGNFVNVTQAAQSAVIKIDNTQVTSDTNNFEDVLAGIDLSIYSTTAGSTITLTVEQDYSGIEESISNFIDSYNNLRQFVMDNQTVSDSGTAAVSATLFADSLLRTLSQQVSSLISNSYGNADISTLRDLSIELDSNNQLSITDTSDFESLLLNNSDSLRDFFESSFDPSNSQLRLLKNTTSTLSLDFTLNITTDSSGAITGVDVDGDTGAFTFSGNTLTGAKGTRYEGLILVYSGSTSSSIDVSFSQGFAEQLYNILNSYSNSTSGSINSAITNLQTQNDSLNDDATKIREDAEAFREKQVSKYADMEAAIEAAKLLQAQIKAILGNNDESSNS